MAEVIRMPKMSDTMVEGVIANWLKKEGDVIKSGDIIAEVETDKATMELENYEDGTLLYIGIKAGEAVPVDGIIAVVGTPGEDYSALLAAPSAAAPAAAPVAEAPQAAAPAPAPVAATAPTIDLSDIKAKAVRMPKMSDTMVEGVIAKWLKKTGDVVKSGDIIAEVETDKATMELENYEDGTLLYIGAKEGEGVIVDGIIAIVGEPGTDFQPILAAESAAPAAAPVVSVAAPAPVQVAEAPKVVETKAAAPAPTKARISEESIKASPLARALAKEKGYNLNWIQGTGEGGRITKNDIEDYNPSAGGAMSTFVSGVESFEDIPNSQMRKTIARRLSESKFSAPEFYLTMEINMDKAIEARVSMNEVLPVKISFNDMVIKATALALTKHPKINSYWMEDRIRVNKHVHIGMAVAVEDGLLVPVIRFANEKSIAQISSEAKELGGKAKSKQLQPKDWEGNTFTVSNLGMFGIDQFTSIINSPESCILAVGGIKETVGVKNGQFYATNIMKLTLTCDHRVADGAAGAAFLLTLKQYLEDPLKMFL
ncbi:2-oxo acid dehydrogenase subunit E2 [Aquirufa regiilacus]|uniref:Dihydrolipoamide acetyltransferase component of pyruvate dehydrogenase complex n=1 Tax=Aquirufa regiilacus TaxID=3024868 RepID=A0ABU3TQU2_9BACT|nr:MULTISPECIES: 2-oxo acid dehydrogenase subunit E2 [unclassified Aquirufa]MDT8886801.1 2-oxo acid dehydrogenase subunit E2 [Aquirufa sp. LEPPI-3A]MDU0808234.1 2-oxo acid dehydrogenase subunit E2 [Aquirufa sp. LEOWEIH-7C]